MITTYAIMFCASYLLYLFQEGFLFTMCLPLSFGTWILVGRGQAFQQALPGEVCSLYLQSDRIHIWTGVALQLERIVPDLLHCHSFVFRFLVECWACPSMFSPGERSVWCFYLSFGVHVRWHVVLINSLHLNVSSFVWLTFCFGYSAITPDAHSEC